MKITKPGEEEREIIVIPVEEPIYSPAPEPVEEPVTTNQ